MTGVIYLKNLVNRTEPVKHVIRTREDIEAGLIAVGMDPDEVWEELATLNAPLSEHDMKTRIAVSMGLPVELVFQAEAQNRR